MTCIYS